MRLEAAWDWESIKCATNKVTALAMASLDSPYSPSESGPGVETAEAQPSSVDTGVEGTREDALGVSIEEEEVTAGGGEGVETEGNAESVEATAGASSAEQRCPVCLGDFQDKAFIDACFHILHQVAAMPMCTHY